MTPLLGGLLLNWRVFLCLNLGADFRGDPGAVALSGALHPVFVSTLGTFKLMFWLNVERVKSYTILFFICNTSGK